MKILLTLLLLSPLAFAEEYKGPLTIEGEMRCKVKDQIILATADGKSQRYAGVENSFNVGDTLFFTYRYTEYFMVPSFMLDWLCCSLVAVPVGLSHFVETQSASGKLTPKCMFLFLTREKTSRNGSCLLEIRRFCGKPC